MKDLKVILYELRNKPHCILPEYATALADKIEQYLEDGEPLDDLYEELMTPTFNVVNGVGIIEINGVIMKRVGVPKAILDLFGIVDLDNVDAQLKEAQRNPEVKSILLAITSPGGFISGVQSTSDLVNEISKEKEVVVYSDVLNASAAMFISSQANTIITSADAIVGSVGVYTEVIDFSKALDNEGVKVHLIKAGKWKGLGNPTQPLSDDQRQFLQDEIDETWATFKSYVKSKRKIDDEWLEGQTVNGTKAVEVGFSDGIENNIDNVLAILTENESKD